MESYKTMETMEEALDKLGCRQNFGQGPVEPVEPVQPHALLDIASLALYGCHALPVRLKILLDRLFSVLRPDQVVQVLRGFGWTQDDYARGYILNEANGASLDRFNICSPEEEPLVLQQFLRFGETRALTEQLLRGAAAPGAAGAASAGPSPASSASSQSSKPGQEASHAHERLQPAREEPVKTTPVHSPHQRDGPASTTAPAPSRHSPPPTSPGHRDARDDDKRMPHALNFSLGSSASSRQGPPSTGAAPVSPQQKHAPSGASSVGRQSPPSGQPTPHSALSFLNRGAQPQPQSPPGSSPLNRLQNMQPFDFRKMAASAVRASPEPPAGPGGVPGLLNLRPPPPPTVPTSTMSSLPLPFGHSSLTAANLVASSFPGLISSAMAGHPGHPSLPPHPGSKSPSTDLTSRAGSSDFGSASDDDDDNSALNLSRDRDPRDRDDKMRAKRSGSPPQQRSSKHPSSSFSPLKRQSAWPSSHLPANLGTQLINPTTGKKRVQCNVCLKTFCDKGALKIHFSAVHLREMHRCTVEGCSMMFSSRRSRNRHSANPNPKLHSPHLRRKISPHDGRSAQSHPILLPPHQAGLGVGLNPLSFGAFPLLPQDPRDPRDPRNAAMAAAAAAAGGPSALDLNLKNSLGLSLRYEREARERHREMTSMSMDEDDDDDEEGIVVVGGADDDDDEPQDLHQSKRLKFSVSDDGDDHSNTDDDSQSALDLGTSAASASNGVDHHGLGHHFAAQEPSEQARSGRKRKSQNPTRCTQPIAAEDLSNYDDSSSDAGSHMYPDQGAPPEAGLDLAVRRKSPDHTDTEERLAREQDSVQPPHEEGSSQDDQVFRLTKEKKGDSIEPPTENRVREMMSAAGGVKEDVEEEKDSVIKAEADPNGLPSSPCAGSPPCSPAASPASSLELGDGSHDEDGYFYPDGYFANIDVPMDKDNPRKCTACGKVFQNHFGVKTHYQNVHLKLMHKCTVDGCNAAFPSKRSRDRHSANLNLHRKLLSTSSSPTHGDKPGHPMFHPDVLARLYADPGMQGGRPLDHHPLLMAPFGYPAMGAMGAMGFHPLNGRAGSASPTSPRSLDEELMGRPAKPHDVHDPFLGARSRSDPGGLAMEPGLPLGLTHAAALAQRRASASDS